ncbi:uncharacterized protein DS421_14g455510 [Arachis hypogaea]|nr:uncharacterized protein DS421_14g455510 [Arachis hypogaea]
MRRFCSSGGGAFQIRTARCRRRLFALVISWIRRLCYQTNLCHQEGGRGKISASLILRSNRQEI